jgi:hypothetical protein
MLQRVQNKSVGCRFRIEDAKAFFEKVLGGCDVYPLDLDFECACLPVTEVDVGWEIIMEGLHQKTWNMLLQS